MSHPQPQHHQLDFGAVAKRSLFGIIIAELIIILIMVLFYPQLRLELLNPAQRTFMGTFLLVILPAILTYYPTLWIFRSLIKKSKYKSIAESRSNKISGIWTRVYFGTMGIIFCISLLVRFIEIILFYRCLPVFLGMQNGIECSVQQTINAAIPILFFIVYCVVFMYLLSFFLERTLKRVG